MVNYGSLKPENYAGKCSRCGYEERGYNLGLQLSAGSHIGNYQTSKPISLDAIPVMRRL